jgi:hypothetical protein
MNTDTFGNSIKFPSLNVAIDKINELPKNQQKFFQKTLITFNQSYSYLSKCKSSVTKEYLLHLLRNELMNTLDRVQYEKSIDPSLISHLKCFIVTKIKILIKENKYGLR